MEVMNLRDFSLMFHPFIIHPTFIHHLSLYNLILLNLIMNICYNAYDSMLTTHALVFAKTRTPKMDHFMRLQLS
jgi:hypothetical protein